MTVVSDEPHPFYSRVLTSHYLSGNLERSTLFLASADTYRSLGIDFLPGRRVVTIGEDEVETDDGRTLKYERLLLATGSQPVGLRVPGADLPGVFTLRTLADAEAIRNRAEPGCRALVVGGGMIGFKTTEGLLGRGVRVTMAVSSPYVLSQSLDEEGGRLVARMLRQHGVEVRTGVDVTAVESGDNHLDVHLSDGEVCRCRLVVVGKGVRPNVELARALGLTVERGIVCDDHMGTSRTGVFAAGDVAEVFDPSRGEKRVNAIWPHAVAQGRVAGENMVQPGSAYFWGGIGRNALCLGDIRIISGGLVAPREPGYEVITARGSDWYRRLVLKDGRAVGAVFVGDIGGAGVALSYVQSGKEAAPLAEAFRSGRIHAGIVMRAVA